MRLRAARRLGPVAGILAAVVLTGCRHQVVTGPPRIRYGDDVCNFCQMVIEDPRYAAALVYRQNDGQRVAIFDDIGCMLAWQRNHPSVRPINAFVHDYNSRQWFTASQAWYVRSPAIQSPMGWGIASGKTQADAKAAVPGGQVRTLSFDELLSIEQNKRVAVK